MFRSISLQFPNSKVLKSMIMATCLALGMSIPTTAVGISTSVRPEARSVDWLQFGQNGQHQGSVSVSGQSLDKQLGRLTSDPFVDAEKKDGGGGLLAHYQVPLLDGTDVYMMVKTGSYTAATPSNQATRWNSQVWNERLLHWDGGQVVQAWNFESDWKPVSSGLALGWEPAFGPTLAGPDLYVPGAGGTIFRLDRATGRQKSRINPFGPTPDPSIYVAGPLTAAKDGSIYYDALKLDSGEHAVDSWLVKVHADGRVTRARFADLVPGAPTTCVGAFDNTTLPWPASPEAVPASGDCGPQRPGLNVAPAIAPDGTVYTMSRADQNERYSYLVATNSELRPKWTASLRDRLDDGCGRLVPIAPTTDPARGACRHGAKVGVDPQTNQRPAGRVRDNSSASPAVMPDGSVLYDAWMRYSSTLGHIFKFSPTGTFQGSFDAAWDDTPTVFQKDGKSHILVKENHYQHDFGTYCNAEPGNPVSEIVCATAPNGGPYYITQLSSDLSPEWRFKNTNTKSCTQKKDGGSVDCVSDHPDSFEWCVNAIAVDGRGTVYANSEDGNLYSIPQGHRGTFDQPSQRFFLGLSLDSAYTPLSISRSGRVFTSNNGQTFAVGKD